MDDIRNAAANARILLTEYGMGDRPGTGRIAQDERWASFGRREIVAENTGPWRPGEHLASGATVTDSPIGESNHEVVVARYQGQPEAEMWAELLRNEGIPTVVIQLLPGARLAWGMVPCELRVRSTDLMRARALLGLEP